MLSLLEWRESNYRGADSVGTLAEKVWGKRTLYCSRATYLFVRVAGQEELEDVVHEELVLA